MKHFTDELFKEYLTEGQLTLPIYCGSSVAMDADGRRIYYINLYAFSQWAKGQVLPEKTANLLRDFIREKINNGTLYTEDSMSTYPYLKRLQLFVNSNIAEHIVVSILGGTLLTGNDELTLDSVAIIGADGCAKADVEIDGIEVEVKVTYNNETAANVLAKAHKKPVVIVYIISPELRYHWYAYIRDADGNYNQVAEVPANEFEAKVLGWQTALREKSSKLPLLYFKDNIDGSASITQMYQKY